MNTRKKQSAECLTGPISRYCVTILSRHAQKLHCLSKVPNHDLVVVREGFELSSNPCF
jgi:hypothetical protein